MKKLILFIFTLFTASFMVAQPCVTITGFSVTSPSCFGDSNGSVLVTYSPGIAPYSIYISGTVTQSYTTNSLSQNIGGLPDGYYNLIIADNNGCVATQSLNLISPPPLLISASSWTYATCGLYNGSTTITVFGGTPAYNVIWNLLGTPSGASQTNMPPGVWTATVTDANACIIQHSVNIASPPFPSITSFSVTPPSCFGLSNGVLAVNYSAGTAPYTITWSSPLSQTITTAALSQSVSGVASGAYIATVTDSYGCQASQPVNVSQPALLVLFAVPNATICNGESTQIAAFGSGGTPPYTYSWTPNTLVGGGPHMVSPTTSTFYTVDISDANGCSPSPKVITVDVNLCTGIDELNNSDISFYPNPSHDLVQVKSNENIQSIEMTTISGQMILVEKVNANTYTLSLQKNTEGIYFVKLRFSDGRNITKKIVKQ